MMRFNSLVQSWMSTTVPGGISSGRAGPAAFAPAGSPFAGKLYAITSSNGTIYTVAADGTPRKPAKAHNWKANYHDVRAMIKFIDVFAPARGG